MIEWTDTVDVSRTVVLPARMPREVPPRVWERFEAERRRASIREGWTALGAAVVMLLPLGVAVWEWSGR